MIVNDDIGATLDIKCKTVLGFDLSSAFDTNDHVFLMTRMDHSFGIKNSALAWLRSSESPRGQRHVD